MQKLFFLLLVSICLHTAAQKTGKPLVDSLLKAIPAAENDTVKARLYNKVYNELCFINIDEAMQYARIGLAHSQKMNWPKGIAVFQTNIGRSFSDMGNYDSTIYYYKAALATHTKANDKYNMSSIHNNLGAAAQNIRSDYTSAANYYFKALKLAEEINDSTLLSVSLNNIAIIYMLQKNYTKALEFNNKALRIREKKGNADEIATSLENIGKIYYLDGNLTKAKEYFQQSLTLYEGTGNIMGLAMVWSSLALSYDKDYRSVVEARIKSKQLWDEVNPMHSDAITNIGNLGSVYLDIVRYDTNHRVKYGDVIPDNKNLLLQKAALNLNTAIQFATQSGDIDSKSFFTGILAEVQELTGDYKNAYYNFKLFKETQDSIYSQENKNKIAATESQLEIDKKNNELKIKQLALSNQQKTMWGLIGGLVLLGLIGFLFYRQNLIRKKANNALVKLNVELDNANKVKAKFFAILSHDLRAPVSNLINFLHLQKTEPDLFSPEQTKVHQQKISTAAEGLLANMEAMLLWSKSQMENFKPVKSELYVSTLFEQLNRSFLSTGIVAVDLISTEKIRITTDENYLLAIMHNLTSNAINALKNSKDAAIVWKAYKNADNVFFIISDNGPGLPLDVISSFQNKEDVIAGKNGFGFHIIKDMAKAINCTITFESDSNGTAFKLILPA